MKAQTRRFLNSLKRQRELEEETEQEIVTIQNHSQTIQRFERKMANKRQNPPS